MFAFALLSGPRRTSDAFDHTAMYGHGSKAWSGKNVQRFSEKIMPNRKPKA
jgi:hypothetical protein